MNIIPDCKKSKITPVLFQTNKKYEQYVENMIMQNLGDLWKYEFYNDEDVIKFFTNNPCEEFPDIISKYNSILRGTHKADLFRYYYLYLKGGFFLDYDAMLYDNIENIVKDFDFVSVKSHIRCRVFQGVLAASPNNEIIKKALYNAYNINPEILKNNYFYFCNDLYKILYTKTFNYKIKLYTHKDDKTGCSKVLDDNNNIIFKHYWKHKIIPNNYINFNKNDKKLDTETFYTKYGIITLNSKDVYFINSFKKNKYWDETTLQYLKNNFIYSGNILEIGGHSGTSTLFYAKCLNKNCKIYSFEPQKKMYELLMYNIKQNNLEDKVEIFNKALFCYNGTINMNNIDMDGPHKNNSISKLENDKKYINYGGLCLGNSGELVECITLDSLNMTDIKFIHCDAQGSEPFIFFKGKEFIKKHKPIILYENSDLHGKYLLNCIKKNYPIYKIEAEFDIKQFCIKELNYTYIDNLAGSRVDTLLIPPNFNKNKLQDIKFTI